MSCDLDCINEHADATDPLAALTGDRDNGLSGVGARQMELDELRRVVDTISAQYSHHPRGDIERLVVDAYQHLAANAKITSHLIPLTLNRSLRLMRSVERHLSGPPTATPSDAHSG